jgi:anti-sigma factor RsiW
MHTSFQQLINYLQERLSTAQVTEVSLHLARCPECRRALGLAGQFLTNTRGGKPKQAANRVTPVAPYSSTATSARQLNSVVQ